MVKRDAPSLRSNCSAKPETRPDTQKPSRSQKPRGGLRVYRFGEKLRRAMEQTED